MTQNQTLPFWSHSSLKPISISTEEIKGYEETAAVGDENDIVSGEPYNQVNTVENEVNGSDFEDEDANALINTWESGGDLEKKMYKEEMENYIHLIRDFCDSLEYQIKFQDCQFLSTLQKDGARFFQFAQNCLDCEKRQNSSQSASPTTWERSTANALFYRSCPCCDCDT